MGEEASASRLDRRSLLMGGAVAGAAVFGATAGEADAAEPEETEGEILIGRIAGHRASGDVELDTETGGTVVVRAVPGAEVLDSDGDRKSLSDFAVGDGIAVDLAGGGAAGGTVGARRVTPCVLGSRSDVKR